MFCLSLTRIEYNCKPLQRVPLVSAPHVMLTLHSEAVYLCVTNMLFGGFIYFSQEACKSLPTPL